MHRKFLTVAVTLVCACGSDKSITGVTPLPDPEPPALVRETRGMWIATVANIDWPSRNNLSADQQRAELIDLLDRAAATGINTVVFQVRPAGDAVYDSSLEPWAILLTGVQGQSPGYDPLAFAIQEAHARGMELHAWINPYRAGNTADTLKLVAPHLFRTRRDLIRIYGSNIWMDPGEPDVLEHSIKVVTDIVTRYDIDGIHADDYFYPYVVNDAAGKPIPFPDDATYAKYGNGMVRDDWRRDNVNRFVQRMYTTAHAIKPTLKVGISPFGIWRPGFPGSVLGLDAYATIYADSRKWLQQGWVDYLAPQLYWSIAAPNQGFLALYNWWRDQNPMDRHVWPGLAAYRVNDGTSSAFSLQEIPNQIIITHQNPDKGAFLYNATWTLKQNNRALATLLASDLYSTTALVPASPWLDSSAPFQPTASFIGNELRFTKTGAETPRWWAVRLRTSGTWSTKILFGSSTSLSVAPSVDRALVQAVDQAGNTSSAADTKR